MEECQHHTEDQHVKGDILIFGKHNLPRLAKLLGERLHKGKHRTPMAQKLRKSQDPGVYEDGS